MDISLSRSLFPNAVDVREVERLVVYSALGKGRESWNGNASALALPDWASLLE